MTKQKQIEGHMGLNVMNKSWLDVNKFPHKDFNSGSLSYVIGIEQVYDKLLEQQAKIDSLTEQNKDFLLIIQEISGASPDICMCGSPVSDARHDHDIVTELDWVIGNNGISKESKQ